MQLYVFSQNLHLHSRDYKNPLKMTPYPLVRGRGGVWIFSGTTQCRKCHSWNISYKYFPVGHAPDWPKKLAAWPLELWIFSGTTH